ncbi:MAG: DbpA RNA binding domain-containing protein [Sphaerochaetaceae bacterium]
MTDQPLPSLLQRTLDELESKRGPRQSLFIEAGTEAVPIALQRSIQLSQQYLSTHITDASLRASEPPLLLLLPQQEMEKWLHNPQNPFCKEFTCLFETNSPRFDLSSLNAKSQVLATTAQRAIDHIRRDNIFLSETAIVVVAYEFTLLEGEDQQQLDARACAFWDDCRFILTKLNQNVHVELYVNTFNHLKRDPKELVANPLLLFRQMWERPVHPLFVISTDALDTESVMSLLYAEHKDNYLVVMRTEKEVDTLKKGLKAAPVKLQASGIGLRRLLSLNAPMEQEVETVILVGLKSKDVVQVIRIIGEYTHASYIIALATEQEAHNIITSKETLLMNSELKAMPETQEVVAGKIQMLVAKLNIDNRPDEIEELKKIIKKNVPFYRRGHFSAYLLREHLAANEKKPATRAKASAPETAKPAPKTQKSAPKQQTPPVPEGARTLYLNVGKMRRLYAKELSQILIDQLGITREDIFALRIHDKYSFITLSQEHADKALEKMQGIDIRGRTASISYSNKE